MARQERSAGVIVFRVRSSAATSSAAAQREYLLLDYGRHWDYPKGHVHAAEDDCSAALRELQEETGIRSLKLITDFRDEIAYFFRHPQRGLVRKTVAFFLAEALRPRIRLSHEHVGYAFLPFAQAMRRATYPTARKLLERAERFLAERLPHPAP